MKAFLFSILALLICFSSAAQNKLKPCSDPGGNQFDFWIGTWNLYSADTLTGTNSIYKILDDCTVQENFESINKGLIGKSWSMYNTNSRSWQQTWVDNQGGYIVLNGEFDNGSMVLYTAAKKQYGKSLMYRMRYHDIMKDGFEWDWESSKDDGVTWKSTWHIRYERRKN